MNELVMIKRLGRPGEIGLFVNAAPFEDDFEHVKMGVEVQVRVTSPRSLRQLKFAWALASKISEACSWVETKEDCMDFMLIEAKHFRRIYDPLRKVAVLKPKPTNFGAMDGMEYTRLLKRLVHVAVTIMVPGMNDAELQAEILQMIGPDIDPPPKRPRKKSPAMEQGAAEEVQTRGQNEAPLSWSDDGAPADSPPLASRPALSKASQ